MGSAPAGAQLAEAVAWTADEEARLLRDAPRHPAGEGWTYGDLVWHLAFWRRHLIRVLTAVEAGAAPPDREGTEEDVNGRELARSRTLPWPEIEATSDATTRELVQRLASVPEPQLQLRLETNWRQGEVLWEAAIGVGVIHPLAHLIDPLLEEGRADVLRDLHRGAVARIAPLPRGEASYQLEYNLACMAALAGDREAALQALERVLPLYAPARAWAPDDSDLVSLRGDPRFEALLEG